MSLAGSRLSIVGAGPTGALLSILLRRRGAAVTIYDSRGDPRDRPFESGRSINLALADRGINALRSVGVYEDLRDALVPMRGRMVHDRDGGVSLQPYGVRPEEVIYSISRQRLNQVVLQCAERRHGVEVLFEHCLESADFQGGIAQVRDLRRGRLLNVAMQPLLACDGAGSRMRRNLRDAGLIAAQEDDLEHGYKELSIPAGRGGEYVLSREALHIWPRGGHMLIALPNDDGSFTATLFMSKQGAVSFANLTSATAIDGFFAANFPDAAALMPNRVQEFLQHPTGVLGTVHAAPWHHLGQAALVGDAAHAIVPFHGQGMNCCFEDCLEFDACVGRQPSWEARFEAFFAARKADTDAIAAMALQNYQEMRELVADPKFQLQSVLSRELQRLDPRRFIPRYSMVMFHHEIPYSIAQRRGAIQTQLLQELTRGAATLADIDLTRARREIERRLLPIDQDLSSVTKL